MINILNISALVGALLFFVVAIEYSLVLRRNGYLFFPGFLFSAVWSATSWQPYTMDFLHAAVWGCCFLVIFERNSKQSNIALTRRLFWIVPLMAVIGAVIATTQQQPTQLQFYFYLICCVGTLLIAEQLIRNTHGLTKVTGLSIGTLFLYNLYLYSYALIAGSATIELVQARALGHTALAIIMLLAPLVVLTTDTQRKKLELSRPSAFTTSSLIMAGTILLTVSALGYLAKFFGDEISIVAQPFLLFIGILFVGFNLASSTRRAKMRVFVDRHFFQAKYDYYDEWQKLSERLSLGKNSDDYAAIALQSILPIFKSKTGACFINTDGYSRNVFSTGMNSDLRPLDITEHKLFFEKMLAERWIYVLSTADASKNRNNELIPKNLYSEDNVLFIIPLTSKEKVNGFIIVADDNSDSASIKETFNWEDFHLLRLVGKQISNFVGYQMLMNERIVTQQFDAYHQFTTFVMHDLKNLIAQQALVVQNAARFMHKPEFVEDAIETIEHSVKKMNRMVLKLNAKSAIDLDKPQLQRVLLEDVIEAALTKCSSKEPTPVFAKPIGAFFVAADFENLMMAFTHLLSNAQEACETDGHIEIEVNLVDTEVECKITDNGEGMDQEFIDQRLFKPFDSTKKTLGMGIGAYQYQQILSKIGGRISVTSKLGEGSCFTVVLPKAEQKNQGN
ncbi:MAG: putative PEP-CTERM system histidine kinase [Candidatus Azotimanducaceae bacterium]|jgi:putative PEP-CTERM system histidine kinase